MRVRKVFLVFFVVVNFTIIVLKTVSAQPKISKNNISSYPESLRCKIENLYSSDPKTRAYSAYELGELGEKGFPAVQFLIEILTDSTPLRWWMPPKVRDTSVGEEARLALIKIGKPAVESLIAALNHKNQYVRRGVAKVLGDIKDNRAIEPLIEALKKCGLDELEDRLVLKEIAIALGSIKDNRAIEPLITTLEKIEYTMNYSEQLTIANALREITGEDYRNNSFRWKEWWKKNKEKLTAAR